MAIRMRVCKEEESKCKICGKTREKSLEMFEISFTDKQIIRICDLCNEALLSKVLKASCMVNHKLKSNADLKVINLRKRLKDKGVKNGD